MVEKIFQSVDIASLLWDYLYNKWFVVNFEFIEPQKYKIIVSYTQELIDSLTDSEKEVIKFFLPAIFGDNSNNVGIN